MSKRILPGVIDSISRGYNILGSSRFDSDKSAYFSQNFKYNGNQKTWTFSTWIKLNDVSTYQCIFSQVGSPLLIGFTNGRFRVDLAGVGFFETTEYFRDPNAWYHYMLVFDTTQATAANRAKIFINGLQSNLTFTSWTPTQNVDYGINSAVEHRIGQYGSGGYLLKSQLADTYFIDGQALTPSSFGETSTITSTWIPKKYAGTYGRNGFYLNHFNKAMKFDGSSTYYDTGVSTFASTNTWSLWIKPTVSGGPLVNKVSYYAFSTNDFPWQLNYNSNTGKIEILVDSGNDYSTDQTIQSTGSQNLADGNWHHVAVVTKSQNYVKIYIDGILDTNATTSVNIAAGSRNYFLGRDAFPYGGGVPGRFYNGSMADVRYFPSELTLGEIQSIYNTTYSSILSSTYVGSDSSTDVYYMSQITFNGSFGARKSTAPTVNVVDSKKGIISMWVDFTGGNGTDQILWQVRNNNTDGNALNLYKNTANQIVFRAGTGDAVTYGSITSSATLTSSSGLTHIAVAWDFANAKLQMYINGVQSGTPSSITNANIDIVNSPFHGIGANQYSPMTPNLQAKVGQVYVNYGEFLDLSISSNLNKFYNSGLPISLGSCGEVPTGNIPTFFLDGIIITKNHGGGGDLDVTTGSYSVGGTITGASCTNRNGFKTYSVAYVNGVMGTVTKDSPTMSGNDSGIGGEVSGNYSTLNILHPPTDITYSTSAMKSYSTSSNTTVSSMSIPNSGKYYMEVFIESSGASGTMELIGFNADEAGAVQVAYNNAGQFYLQGSGLGWETYGASWTTGDYLGIAINVDSNQVTFYKNGVSQGTKTVNYQSLATQYGILSVGTRNNGNTKHWWNFGATPFIYTAPAGFKSFNSNNLPIPSVIKPKSYFDTALYTGNGVNAPNALTISGYGFQPNLVWIKNRGGDIGHIQDSSIGLGNFLASNLTNGFMITGGGDVSSLNSDGFTLSYQNPRTNSLNANYAAWMWKEAGQSGFDIVTYTGTGSNRTIAHNLGQAPRMMIIKRTDTTSNWIVYHASIPNPQDNFSYLNSTATTINAGVVFASTNPTSSVFTVGTDATTNANGGTYVAYLFAEIPGFSKFGKYVGTGNLYGSSNGPFVNLGFKPAFFLIKNITNQEQWAIHDYKRPLPPGNNNTANFIPAQSSGAEDVNPNFHQIDRVSSGFKIRAQAQDLVNLASSNYIYAAFAENPFKYATAR